MGFLTAKKLTLCNKFFTYFMDNNHQYPSPKLRLLIHNKREKYPLHAYEYFNKNCTGKK